MKRIHVDLYAALNLGDDLFLDILLSEFNTTNFTLNYFGDDYEAFLNQYHNLSKRRYYLSDKILRRLNISDTLSNELMAKKHDALVYVGGSIFMKGNFHTSLFKNRMNLVMEFKKRNKPVFILGANFGPYKSKQFINDYIEMFKLCNDICFQYV